MNKVNRFMSSVALALFFVGTAAADTLELKDGRVLKGKYLGGTQAVMRFELNGEIQTFNTLDIVALTFTGNFGHSAAAPAPAPAAAPVPSMGNSAYGGRGTNPPRGPPLAGVIDGGGAPQNNQGGGVHAA